MLISIVGALCHLYTINEAYNVRFMEFIFYLIIYNFTLFRKGIVRLTKNFLSPLLFAPVNFVFDNNASTTFKVAVRRFKK